MINQTEKRSARFLRLCAVAAGLFLLVLVAKESAMGQNAPAEARTMTLKGAVDLALKQNLDLQMANIQTAVRQQDRAIARSALLPHAGLEANDAITRYNTRAQLGIQPAIVPHEIGPYQAIHAGAAFSTPVFDLTLIREYQASGHRLAATRDDDQTVREETVLLTVSAYMAHLRALASITAAQSRVDLASRLVRQAQDLLTDGVASKIDVSRAQVRLKEEQQRLIDSQTDADTTLNALKRILNIPDGDSIGFADEQDFFSTPSFNVADPLASALKQRPELHSMTENIEADELAHKAAVSELLPKIEFNGTWNEQGQTFTTTTPGYQYQVGLRVPLFAGGRLAAERRRTALEAEKAQKRLAQERNDVTQQVRDGQAELEAALSQVELGRQQVQLANEELTLSQGRFRSGVTDNIEVTAAQDSLARANDAEIDALFRYNLARAQLARAVGSEQATYSH